MASIRKTILLVTFLFLAAEMLSADFDPETLPEHLATATKNFLEADTGKARSAMATFSNDDLQKIANSFKKSHDASGQRIFWLIEEHYRRNAERVAAERIRYLYYAVLAALAIIAAFTGLTYASARKQRSIPAPESSTPTNIPQIHASAPLTPKRSRKKGR